MDQLSSGQGKANYPEFCIYLVWANKSLNVQYKGMLLPLLSLSLISDIASSISFTVTYV